MKTSLEENNVCATSYYFSDYLFSGTQSANLPICHEGSSVLSTYTLYLTYPGNLPSAHLQYYSG